VHCLENLFPLPGLNQNMLFGALVPGSGVVDDVAEEAPSWSCLSRFPPALRLVSLSLLLLFLASSSYASERSLARLGHGVARP